MDLHRYDEKWERRGSDVLHEYFHIDRDEMAKLLDRAKRTDPFDISTLSCAIRPKEDVAILDLRQAYDFDQGKLPGSTNLPVALPGTRSPFFDPPLLSQTWTTLENLFNAPSEALKQATTGKRVLVVCYDGDTARVAASVMRAKGHNTDSLRGGLSGLATLITSPSASDSESSLLSMPSWLQLSEAQDGPSQTGGTASQPSSKLLSMHHPVVRA